MSQRRRRAKVRRSRPSTTRCGAMADSERGATAITRSEIVEARELAAEAKVDASDRTVALLADDYFSDALVLRVRVVDLVAIDKKDHVGILFDGTGLAQVRHDGALVGALLHRAVELRQRDHRHRKFFCQRFQRARDLGDFGRTILTDAGSRHELQIVNDDETQLATGPRQPARAG